MKKYLIVLILFYSCTSVRKIDVFTNHKSLPNGEEFYKQAIAMQWKQRDSFAVNEILAGDIPDFLKRFVAIKTSIFDSVSKKNIHAIYYVTPDYLSIGNNKN